MDTHTKKRETVLTDHKDDYITLIEKDHLGDRSPEKD